MKPRNRTSGTQRGLTLIEVVVGVAVLGLAVAIGIGAAQPEADRAAKIARCANNLRLLAAAAHCYADDFEEKFFYQWESAISPTGERRRDFSWNGWYDPQRVGRYLAGDLLPSELVRAVDLSKASQEQLKQVRTHYGLGGGVFVCPEDLGAGRSYSMNFWASAVDVPVRWEGYQWGRFFNRQTQPASKLMLFGEALGTMSTGDDRWVPASDFGARFLPGERFGGRVDDQPMLIGGMNFNQARWDDGGEYPTQIDYLRHGTNPNPKLAEGAANFAYADGHVALRNHTDLYNPETRRSTYDTLWSVDDRAIEERHFAGERDE